jgi:hypothetical protein
MDKSDVMECRNWRNGTCPKSVPKVLEEDKFYTQMGCETCRGGWVVSMPEGKARARYENRLSQIKQAEQQRREREAQPVYFT